MVAGYQFAGVCAGIKKNDRKDLGLIYSEVPATVAGVFTQNRVPAAPVVLDRRRIQGGICRAVIVNSGNANCCTGDKGIQDAIQMARGTASRLKIDEDHVLVASTGVIGEPLPVDKINAALPELIDALQPDGVSDFAAAIMTTDTEPKVVVRQGNLDGKLFNVAGIAKGAGMIRPDMATLLCFVLSDIDAPADLLHGMLKAAVDRSLNRITIDGDTSTNDTALLLANGLSGAAVKGPKQVGVFQPVLEDVLMTLARWLVKDGEGATKLVDITVKGAKSDVDARKVVDTIAHSNLVKTALFGEDANWGRILAAIGRAGVSVEPNKIDVWFGAVQMVQNGLGCGKAAESKATEVLKTPEFSIMVDLKSGSGSAAMLTCDFSVDYVKINADYRS